MAASQTVLRARRQQTPDHLDDFVRAEQAQVTETHQLSIVLAGPARELRVERWHHAVVRPCDRHQLAAGRDGRGSEFA